MNARGTGEGRRSFVKHRRPTSSAEFKNMQARNTEQRGKPFNTRLACYRRGHAALKGSVSSVGACFRPNPPGRRVFLLDSSLDPLYVVRLKRSAADSTGLTCRASGVFLLFSDTSLPASLLPFREQTGFRKDSRAIMQMDSCSRALRRRDANASCCEISGVF